jgi:hypothetical protein
MASPKFNLNAARTGTKLVRLTVGELPRQLNSVKIEGRRYRRALEDATIEVRGEVSVTDAHLIDTATAAMVHAGICRWLLREKIDGMGATDVLACSREMLRAKETRDRSVRALRLDRDIRRNVIEALYGPADPEDAPGKGPGFDSKGRQGAGEGKSPSGPACPIAASPSDNGGNDDG